MVGWLKHILSYVQDLLSLMKKLEQLKAQAPSGDPGAMADRLAALQKNADVLTNTTENMLKALNGNSKTTCLCITEKK